MKNLRNLAMVISIVILLFSAVTFTPHPVILRATQPLTPVKPELTQITPTADSSANLTLPYSEGKTASNTRLNAGNRANSLESIDLGGSRFSIPLWPALIALANHQVVKSKEAITPIINETSTPIRTTNNQDMPQMIKFPEEGIPVLMYHSISTIPGNSLGVPVKQFKEEMEWLRRQNYHSLSLEEFYQALVNKTPVPDKPILLTFDDGYSDNYSEAWPTLRHNGFKATFFVVTNSVGPGMMNWDQLNDLSSHGNSIGSHTVQHLDLATLSNKQQENELKISKQELESHLGISEQTLCFPSGRYNKTTLELMPQLGYRLGFTTHPGKVHLGDDLLTLKRVRISGGMSLASFQQMFP